MELSDDHLAQLVLVEIYMIKFGYANYRSTFPEYVEDLLNWNLVEVAKEDKCADAIYHYVVLTEEGKQALEDIGVAAIVDRLFGACKHPVVRYYLEKLTLADLPCLLSSRHESIRGYALAKYMELESGIS